MIIIKNHLLLLRLYIEYNLIWNNIYFLLRKIYIKIIKRKIMIIIKNYWFYIMVWIKKRKRKKRRAFVHHRFNQNKAKMSRHFYTALHFKVLLLFLSLRPNEISHIQFLFKGQLSPISIISRVLLYSIFASLGFQ